jgi:hypothetical protein
MMFSDVPFFIRKSEIVNDLNRISSLWVTNREGGGLEGGTEVLMEINQIQVTLNHSNSVKK